MSMDVNNPLFSFGVTFSLNSPRNFETNPLRGRSRSHKSIRGFFADASGNISFRAVDNQDALILTDGAATTAAMVVAAAAVDPPIVLTFPGTVPSGSAATGAAIGITTMSVIAGLTYAVAIREITTLTFDITVGA